jgi:hypothetical protein
VLAGEDTSQGQAGGLNRITFTVTIGDMAGYMQLERYYFDSSLTELP